MRETFTAYEIQNSLTGKIYIGLTKVGIGKRFSEHIKASRGGSLGHLHRSMRKYGVKFFQINEIGHAYSYDLLKKFEVELIRQHNSFAQGYNMTLGGEGSLGRKFTHSIQSRVKMSIARTGVKFSEEHKSSMCRAQTGLNSPRSRGRIHTPGGVFDTTRLAGKFHKVSHTSVRSRCMSFSLNWSKWFYEDQVGEECLKMTESLHYNKKAIHTPTGVFGSLKLASNSHGIHRSTVKNRCRNPKQKWQGWFYEDMIEEMTNAA